MLFAKAGLNLTGMFEISEAFLSRRKKTLGSLDRILLGMLNNTTYFEFCKKTWSLIVFTSRKQVRVTNTPYTPLLYSKTGVHRGVHFFLFLLQNIDCGYSLEPPH